jgi:hypothetical protein
MVIYVIQMGGGLWQLVCNGYAPSISAYKSCTGHIEDNDKVMEILNREFHLSLESRCPECKLRPHVKDEIAKYKQMLDRLCLDISKHLYRGPSKIVMGYMMDNYMCHHCTLKNFVLENKKPISIKYYKGKKYLCSKDSMKESYLSNNALRIFLQADIFKDIIIRNGYFHKIISRDQFYYGDNSNNVAAQHVKQQRRLTSRRNKYESKKIKN